MIEILLSGAFISFISALAVLAAILVGVFLIYRMGRFIVRFIIGVIVNTIFGFFALVLLNSIFHLQISYSFAVLLATALFGLVAVSTFVILKVLGGVALAIFLL